jgi:hypothetical protein
VARWIERRTSSRLIPESSAIRIAEVVLPRPGPPTSSARRQLNSVSIGISTNEL